MKIVKPKEDGAKYWCRKGFYSINLQAICDHKRKFTWFSAAYCGSTHDSVAFAQSRLGEILSNPQHPIQKTGFWIAGDDAYKGNASQCNCLLTPWPSQPGGIGPWEDSFNAHQSSCRIEIECAFGALVKRWAILQKPLCVSPNHATLLLETLLHLHNVCTEARIKDACGRARDGMHADYRGPEEDWPDIDVDSAFLTGAIPEAPGGGTNQPLRDALTSTLQQHNKLRPPRMRYRGYRRIDG